MSEEWDSFDQRANQAKARVYRVGGNHDLGNTVMREVWGQRYGPLYYHFVYRDTLFLVLNTEDLPPNEQDQHDELLSAARERVAVEGWGIFSETPYARHEATKTGWISEQQANYFTDVIERHPNVRWTFVFMHKPAWKRENEENFLKIEQSLKNHSYTVFYGHFHSYQHQSRFGRDYIQLGTTGGVQNIKKPMALDHVTLVTVDQDEPSIANLRLSGIFDKTGRFPLAGDELWFDAGQCRAD